LKRGLALEARHDYARAIIEFRNAGQARPSDAEPEYQLGMAYLTSGHFGEAIEALRRAVELNPKHARAQIKLADLMLNSHDRDLIQQAAGQLQTLLDSDPDNTAAAGRLAVAEWSLGKLQDAENRLQQALEKFPADLTSAVTLARFKLDRDDARGALEVLQRATRNSPRSVPAAIALAQVYVMNGRTAEAEAELRRALELDPHSGIALLSLASIQIAGHRPDEAEATLRKLSDLADPAYNGAYGEFLLQRGRRAAALAEFERLVKATPGERIARSRLIAAYMQMNRVPDAEKLLAQALKQNPKDTDALLERSIISLEAGNLEQAEADLHQVILFVPNSAEAHFALAAVFKARGMVRNERQELTESLRLKPNLLPARLWLVQSLLVAEENQSALGVLEQAPAAQRQMLALVIERNWVLLFLGRSKEVATVLTQVLRYGRFPELVLQDAVLKMQEKDYAAARREAEEVLRQNPAEARAARVVVDSYVAQNQSAKAGEWLAEMVAAHPQSADLERLAGKWFEALQKNSEARHAFAAAHAADPKSISDDLSLAELDLRGNQIQAARQEAHEALQSDPKNIKALLLCGEVEDRSGQPAAAAAYYREVLSLDGNNLMALNNLANYLAVGDPDEALALAQRAMEAAPDNPGVEDTLGWIYYRKGMYRAALDYLKAATAKDPSPRRRFHLGQAYLKLGERDLGQRMVALAVGADPTVLRTEAR